MVNFNGTHGANARALNWDELEEEARSQRTGSWLPLDGLGEDRHAAGPQLRAMPATRRGFLAGAQPTGQHSTRAQTPERAGKQQHAARQGANQIGKRVKSVAMLAGASLCALAAYVTVSAAVQWTQVKLDDLQYGRPRTAQIDAYVGHGEVEGAPSHFIAMNLNRRVTVLEMPGGDASKAATIVGPYLFGEGEDLTPVQISAQDLNGDDKPDMVLSVKNERLLYLNDGVTFNPATPEEQAAIEKSLEAAQRSEGVVPGFAQEAGK